MDNSFHSFLSSETLVPFDSIEASDEFFTGANELIHLWLKRYIEMYNPGFKFEEVVNSIDSVSVTYELIGFTILNPYSQIQESFEFGLGFLKEIQEETNSELKRLSSNKVSFKGKTLSIIQSWLPDITSDKILDIANVYIKGKTTYYSLDDKPGNDYLWIAFSGKNNKPENHNHPIYP